MPIRMLAASVAAGIAAGEVIERPASVVKELVENSLDAGARSISVEIEQGGLHSIRVTDDGCGIVDDEIELAFERHATSKLQTLEDLARIATLGFRGEALASVAAAARVRLSTRTSGAEAASVIEVEGSRVLRRGRESGAPGTTVHVEALFSTIPARLKFIRSTGAETARVRQTVEHLAMANPDVRLSLRADGRNLVQTTGNGGLRDVVAAVLGSDLAEAMIDVAPSARAAFPVRGLVSPPDRNKPNRTGISLLVNGRWIFSSTLSVAVQEAYRGMLMEGRFPVAVLFIDAPPEAVDVNVHPNKREVRFIRDGDSFSSVERSVREALLGADPVAEARGLFPTQRAGHDAAAAQAFDFTLAPNTGAWAPLPEPAQPFDVRPPTAALLPQSTGLNASVDAMDAGNAPPADPLSPSPQPYSPQPLRVLGQIANTYIVAEGPGGMVLIDQHAAHESVLYYRLLKQWEARAPESQPMLDPLPVELTPDEMDGLSGVAEVLGRYGLELEPFGDTTWMLRAVPAMARRVDCAALLHDVLASHRSPGAESDARLAVAASIACHSAVRAGQTLDHEEMEALSYALASEANPQHCPHGRPTTLRVSTGMLEREFGRA